MAKDTVSNKQLYDSLNEFRTEVRQMFEEFHKQEFNPLKEKVDRLWAWGLVAVGVLSFSAEFIITWIKSNFKL